MESEREDDEKQPNNKIKSISLKFGFFFFFKYTKQVEVNKNMTVFLPLRVVSFETERWWRDGAAAACSTAWRQTVNPEGGHDDASWWKKLYIGPNDIRDIWIRPHPRQRRRPFLLSRHNIRGKTRYREHSKAALPYVFFPLCHSVNHGEERLHFSSPFSSLHIILHPKASPKRTRHSPSS